MNTDYYIRKIIEYSSTINNCCAYVGECIYTGKCRFDKEGYEFAPQCTEREVFQTIKDALELRESLIRCKDCKHRPKIDEELDVENCTASGFSLEFPDDFECPCRCDDPYYSWMPKDDWYCGNGERKEE